MAESIESAKINVSVFKGFYKYTTIKCNLEGRVNLPRCRESEFGEYLYFTFRRCRVEYCDLPILFRPSICMGGPSVG